MIIQKRDGCVEITLSDHDFATFAGIVREIESEYNTLWRGADIHLDDQQVSFIQRLLPNLPKEE